MNQDFLKFKDSYHNMRDRVCGGEKRPRGWVEAYEKTPDGELKLIEKSNLIVYMGRQFIMQRAFNQSLNSENDQNSFISWFGLGTGGAASNVLIPVVPKLTDTELYTPAIINNKSGTNCINNGLLHPIDSITYLTDSRNENKELIGSVIVTIGEDDANGPAGGTSDSDFYDLSEAGLYISDSNTQSDFTTAPDAASHLATLKLFARVTFSSLRKFNERQIVFNWFIYF
jgi:hypothetical protein